MTVEQDPATTRELLDAKRPRFPDDESTLTNVSRWIALNVVRCAIATRATLASSRKSSRKQILEPFGVIGTQFDDEIHDSGHARLAVEASGHGACDHVCDARLIEARGHEREDVAGQSLGSNVSNERTTSGIRALRLEHSRQQPRSRVGVAYTGHISRCRTRGGFLSPQWPLGALMPSPSTL